MDDLKIVEFLLKKSDDFLGFRLHTKNNAGRTPLACSIKQVITHPELSLDIARVLLEQGASLDDTSMAPSKRLWGRPHWRETPLRDIATRSDRADLKKLVAEY